MNKRTILSQEDENWVNEWLLVENAINAGIPLPDGYEFKDQDSNVISATKIVLEKKMSKDYKALAVLASRLAESVLMDWDKEQQVRLAKEIACECHKIFNKK